MTTPAAKAHYLAAHLHSVDGKGYVVFNPHNKPIDELPVIYGFNNGGSPGWMEAVAIAQDGHCLGGHVCSHEGYMTHDLGIVEGSRPDRHAESYQKHYPDGYRMDFVPSSEIAGHTAISEAFRLNGLLPKDPEPQLTP